MTRSPVCQDGAPPCPSPAPRSLAPRLLFALSAAVSVGLCCLYCLHSGRSAGDASVRADADVHPGLRARALSEAPHEEGTPPHSALLFLFVALLVGAATMHLGFRFHHLQPTVVLFVLGVVSDLIMEGFHLREKLGVFGASYQMWIGVDPHLLLFSLLPPLLAGDAMTIDSAVSKRTFSQAAYLAGPGVLVGAMLCACFLQFYFEWSFLLSLTVASILSATDPVAVVALLKELGASPVLTIQIQGESLLNDGTAMVMFTIAYDMLKGVEYSFGDIVMFMLKTVVFAWALGTFIGFFFCTWIRLAGNKLEHNSGMLQILLTICASYMSFILAELVFHISGVLSTVACSLVLAKHMWPFVVSKEPMEHVWHMVEWLGNITIFFVAGVLTGHAMLSDHVGLTDYGHVVVVYLVLLAIRGSFIFASLGLLKWLSVDKKAVTKSEAVVMTWGGLRGALGLALAMTVHHDKGSAWLGEAEATKVLFTVAGIAFLTITINAPTAPALVNRLGILGLPANEKRLLQKVCSRLVQRSEAGSHPKAVTDSLRTMMGGVIESILHSDSLVRQASADDLSAQDNGELVAALLQAEERYNSMPPHEVKQLEDLRFLGIQPKESLLGKVDAIVELVKSSKCDDRMAKAVNKVFMSLINASYWHQIEKGYIKPGSAHAEDLLMSVQVAKSPQMPDLRDLEIVVSAMPSSYGGLREDWWRIFHNRREKVPAGTPTKTPTGSPSEGTSEEYRFAVAEEEAPDETALHRFLQSISFNLFIAGLICVNSLLTVIYEYSLDPEEDLNHYGWPTLQILTSFIFLVELLAKLADQRAFFFKDKANVKDFVIILTGVPAAVLSLDAMYSDSRDGLAVARILHFPKLFRVLRFVRAFRFLHSGPWKSDVSLEAAVHLRRFETLGCFIYAHLVAQVNLIRYFGGDGGDTGMEEAMLGRCCLQSQVQVYEALAMLVRERSSIRSKFLRELESAYEQRRIIEGLEKFVMKGHRVGAITGGEVTAILEPMNVQLAKVLQEIQLKGDGYLNQGEKPTLAHSIRRLSTRSSLFKQAPTNPLPGQSETSPSSAEQDGEESDASDTGSEHTVDMEVLRSNV